MSTELKPNSFETKNKRVNEASKTNMFMSNVILIGLLYSFCVRIYGFYDECKRRYNIKLWKTFTDCFNCLPVCKYSIFFKHSKAFVGNLCNVVGLL